MQFLMNKFLQGLQSFRIFTFKFKRKMMYFTGNSGSVAFAILLVYVLDGLDPVNGICCKVYCLPSRTSSLQERQKGILITMAH